jgi:glutamate decarboxylase
MAMMVYSSLHIFGRRGYELLIDKSIEQAKTFAAMIDAHPEFELMTSPILSLLTYRLRPSALAKLEDMPSNEASSINKKLDSLTVKQASLLFREHESRLLNIMVKQPLFLEWY